jgi:hypothetical protein
MSGSFGGRLAHSLERFAAKWEPAHWTKPRRGEPLIIQGSSPGPHKVLIERADPTYEGMDSKAVNPVVPHRDAGRH